MRDRYEPPNDPTRWYPLPQEPAAGDPYFDHPASLAEPPDAARSAGLRRLSRLTWRATQLGALATVGFATLFARTAPAQTVVSQPHPTPSVKTSAPAPSPSPTKTHRRHHHHHHRVSPSAAPGAAAPSSAAPAPTLAPPTTAPALPPPSPAPSPVQTTSSPSHHGGG